MLYRASPGGDGVLPASLFARYWMHDEKLYAILALTEQEDMCDAIISSCIMADNKMGLVG